MPTPSTSSSTSIFKQSGVSTIDPLLNEDYVKWRAGSDSVASLSYSFPWLGGADAYWQSDYTDTNEQKAAETFCLNDVQIAAVTSALQSWAAVSNLSFTQVSDTATNVGDFRFAFSSAVSDSWGWCYYPDNFWASSADVWINPTYATEGEWTSGSFNYYSLIHETGHGLGLKHPGDYSGTNSAGPYLPASQDYRTYSVMSYNDLHYSYLDTRQNPEQYIGVVPETPMVYDIAAIQYLYGANNSYQTGNNTYTFDPAVPFYKSIWDAGGTDTIDISNFSTDCTLDLRAGSYSSIFYINSGTGSNLYDGSKNLGIAFGVSIENAKGGSGNDTITGNSLANTFTGGGGNDTLTGGDGLDIAVFSGISSDYTITYDAASGVYTIIDKRAAGDGTDHLSGVEHFQFADTTQVNTNSPTVTLFSPNDGAVNVVGVADDIVITFNEVIQKGTGTVAIHVDSSTGTLFESAYNISTSTNLTVSESRLTINPTSSLASGKHYYVTLDAGLVKDIDGNSSEGVETYDFTTADPYVESSGSGSGSGAGAVAVVAGVASIGIIAWVIL